jgi:hypothetical protein
LRLFSTNHLLFITLLAGLANSACEAGGVGDPCVPEDEHRKNFSGYIETETNVESRSYQCETRVCLVANFRGRVSCPYGQPASGMTVDGLPTVKPGLNDDDYCYLPGTKTTNPVNRIVVPVEPQLVARSPDKAVYCSCRCNGPDTNVQYCDCPSGYACEKLIDAYGTASGTKLVGSYCIKDGTQVPDPTKIDQTECNENTYGPRPTGCGVQKHPEGI